MKSRWMHQDGRRILYGDFSGFGRDVDALRAEVEAADRLICSEPHGSVLAIADLNGTVTSSEVVNLFKHSAALTRPYVHAQAVIGLNGLQKFLAQMVARVSGQGMRLFDSADDAAAWLTGKAPSAGDVIGRA